MKLSTLWAESKYLLILSALLAGSAWLNLHQHGKLAAAGEKCRADMVEAAGIAIENERERAARADAQAGRIVAGTQAQTHAAVSGAQGDTNEREATLRTVVVHGDCRMPVGLPRLAPAVAAANAAAGD